MLPFDRWHASSYWRSTVTMAMFHFRDKVRYWSKIVHFFHTTVAFDAPVRGSPSQYCHNIWYEKLECCAYLKVKKVWWYIYSIRFDTIPACDGRTDWHLSTT